MPGTLCRLPWIASAVQKLVDVCAIICRQFNGGPVGFPAKESGYPKGSKDRRDLG
jgi:hypothetical protein